MANEKTTEVWQYRKVYFDINGEPAAYAKIPDSHRIVSVEALKYLLAILDDNMTYAAASEINAIIDNKEQS